MEVPIGEPLAVVMHRCGYDPDMPALVGGYHGTWLPAHEVARRRLSREDLATVGATLGCGVVLPLGADVVPGAADRADRRVPGERQRPPLRAVHEGPAGAGAGGHRAGDRRRDAGERADHDGRPAWCRDRGACAHPDGTVRLVQSLMTAFPAEVAAHERGGCTVTDSP